jgi:hypothetical protein
MAKATAIQRRTSDAPRASRCRSSDAAYMPMWESLPSTPVRHGIHGPLCNQVSSR